MARASPGQLKCPQISLYLQAGAAYATSQLKILLLANLYILLAQELLLGEHLSLICRMHLKVKYNQ